MMLLQALKAAVKKWQEKVARSVHKVHSLFYYWKARKIRHKIHAAFMKKCVVKLQSAYRRKIAKRLFYIVKTIHRNKMALRVQCFIRRFIGYRRALHRKRLKNYLLHHFVQKLTKVAVAVSPNSKPPGLQRASSNVSVMTGNTAIFQEPLISFGTQSAEDAVSKFCSIIYDIAIKAEFTKAYHKSQQIITFEYVRRNLEDTSSWKIKKPATQTSIASTGSSLDAESNMMDESIESIIQSLQIPEHLKKFLLEYLIFLPHAVNWSKYGRTRQLHTSLLERWYGFVAQKLMSCVNTTIFLEAIENTRKKQKQLAASAGATENGQHVDEHGIPLMIEIGSTGNNDRIRMINNGVEKQLTPGESQSLKMSSTNKSTPGSGLSSVKSTNMSSTIQPFTSTKHSTSSSIKAVVTTPVQTVKANAMGSKQLSPWNVETIKAMQRKDSVNTINTVSRHPSESSIQSSSSKGSLPDNETLSAVFHPKNQRDKTPPVCMINSTFAALKEKDQYLESKRCLGGNGNASSHQNGISRCASTRSRTATMETIEELSMDEAFDQSGHDELSHGPDGDDHLYDRFKKEHQVVLFQDNTIRLENSFHIDEILDMFFQVASLSYYSYLKSFDACMLKIDMILCYAFQRLGQIINDNNIPLQDLHNERNGDGHSTINDDNEMDWQTLEDGNDPLLIAAAEAEHMKELKTMADYNYFLPFFHGYLEKDKTLKKLLNRAMKLMAKAKSLVVVGSLEEFELHFRFDFFHSLNTIPIVLYEVKKEFLVKIVNVINSGHSRKEESGNHNNTNVPESNKAGGKNKKSGRPKTTNADDISISATIRVVLSGAVVYITGLIEKFEDIIPPPVHQQTVICVKLMEYLKKLSGAKPTVNSLSSSMSRTDSLSRSNSVVSKAPSIQSMYSRQSSFISRQSSISGDMDSDSQVSSVFEEEVKSQFPLVIRPMVLFHQEVHQLITQFKANYVESDDEDDDNGAQGTKPKKRNSSGNKKKRGKKHKKRKTMDPRTVEGFHQLLQRFSHLEDLGEEFVEYLAQRELHLSLVYQFHVLASQITVPPTGLDNPQVMTTAGSVVSGVTTDSLAASLAHASTQGSSSNPLVIADNLEPVIQFRIPFLDSKRRQLLASNDIRYATILLQRIYRGFVGRKRFKYVYKKKQEILRRRWLSWKVLDKLRIMRAKHELMAIRIQCNVKGWLWRKHLKKMNEEILKVQLLIRRVQAKKKVDTERKRRQGGPQVVDMLPAGKVITLHEHRLQMKVYRSGGNFKFRGIDLIDGEIYYGVCYQQDIKILLQGHNEIVKLRYEGRGELVTSVACKNDQIFSWQYEKIVDFIVSHVDLIHNIHPITNTFFLLPGEEQDKFNRKNDLMLVVKLNVSEEIFEKLQTKHNHLLHGNKDDIMSHSFLPFLKKIIHDEGKQKRLIGNSKNRKNLIRGFNASNNRRNANKKVLALPSMTVDPCSIPPVGVSISTSQRLLPSNGSGNENSNPGKLPSTTSPGGNKLMMAGMFSLQGGNLRGIR